MRLPPSVNALLGALSFAPLLIALSYLPAYFSDEPLVFSGIWAAPFIVLFAAFYGAVVFFMFGLIRSRALAVEEKLAWVVGLLFAAVVAAPVFWTVYYRRGRLP